MNAKQILQRTVNRCIAEGSPVIVEMTPSDPLAEAKDYQRRQRAKGQALRHMQRSKADAARAMLAALQSNQEMLDELMRTSADNDQADTIDTLMQENRKAIAQAEAAGITTEGN